MSRLKIPKNFINIIQDPLTNRTCKTITSHGLTNSIPIIKGIPQGETISPLLWTIFYDPLLSKLNQSKRKVHNLFNNLAFMNDLNLLSHNKDTLQNVLNTTSQFLTVNNISVNPQKTKLIIINSKQENKTIFLNDTPISPNKKNDPIRILGIYLTESSIISPNRNKIENDIITISNSFKYKFITGHTASYIYNKVLLPRIEYRLQTSFLIPNQLIRFQRKINSILKHKFSSEKTLPNKSFFNPYLYNIKPILDLQIEVLISNFQYKLSDHSISPFINLELISLQKTNCVPTSILQNPTP